MKPHLGADLPPEAPRWALVAADRRLEDAHRLHLRHIPDDVLHATNSSPDEPELPGSWGDPAAWTPITSPEQLSDLLSVEAS